MPKKLTTDTIGTPKPSSKSSKNNEIYDFYQHKDIQKHLTKYHNPHFKEHQINIPFRMGLIGSSSSGKTQLLLNIISKMNNTFGHIIVVYKTTEPLYEFLADKIGAKKITFYTKLHELPQPNDLDKKYKEKQVLLIFDDQINEPEKAQEIIKEYHIRGRKICAGVSMCYLSQSFFKIPKIIRQQFNYLVLLKLSSKRDLNLVLSDFSLGVDRDEIALLYKEATAKKFDFLKIDIDNPNDNRKFSHNFTGFFHLDDDDEDATDDDES